MVVIQSSDLIALIRSFTTMFDQLNGCAVSRQWNQMVAGHPLLLRNVDFGNPSIFSGAPIKLIIHKAGLRLRRLKICDFSHSPLPNSHSYLVYDFSSILVPQIIQNLEYLELVGHITVKQCRLLLEIITPQQILIIRLATCPCCLDAFHALIQHETKTIRLESSISLYTSDPCQGCQVCGGTNRWCSSCPGCKTRLCSNCNFDTCHWSNRYQQNSYEECACVYCQASNWNCTIHCPTCHFPRGF